MNEGDIYHEKMRSRRRTLRRTSNKGHATRCGRLICHCGVIVDALLKGHMTEVNAQPNHKYSHHALRPRAPPFLLPPKQQEGRYRSREGHSCISPSLDPSSISWRIKLRWRSSGGSTHQRPLRGGSC